MGPKFPKNWDPKSGQPGPQNPTDLGPLFPANLDAKKPKTWDPIFPKSWDKFLKPISVSENGPQFFPIWGFNQGFSLKVTVRRGV